MKKLICFLFLLGIFWHMHAHADVVDGRSHSVLVSVAPHKFFIDAIAGQTVQVHQLVPDGASFHDYEPTPRQVIQAGKADIWFRIGEPFENRLLSAVQSHHPRMQIVDLRKYVDLITVNPGEQHHCSCCCQNGADLHFWLSPRQAQKQVNVLVATLSSLYPENELLYKKNGEELIKTLKNLDQEIVQLLMPLKNRTFMVGHPAYAYFARDYNLTQLPIEFEGKDPSPRQLTRVLTQAREAHIKTIYVQPQHSRKGADLIADQIGAKVVILDPYSGNYIVNLRNIATQIAQHENTTP